MAGWLDVHGPDNIIKRTVLKNAVTWILLLVRTGSGRGALLLSSGPFPIDLLSCCVRQKRPHGFSEPCDASSTLAFSTLQRPLLLCLSNDSFHHLFGTLVGGGVCLHSSTYSRLDLIIPLLCTSSRLAGGWDQSVIFCGPPSRHQLAYLELFYW